MDVNLDDEINKTLRDQRDAEKKLIEIGFPEEHWLLIRKYVDAAIGDMQLRIAKGWVQMLQELQKPDS